MTWHTTDVFLSHFNLETLKDLPGLDELKAAGMLDARPVATPMLREDGDDAPENTPDEDAEFDKWAEEETDEDESDFDDDDEDDEDDDGDDEETVDELDEAVAE